MMTMMKLSNIIVKNANHEYRYYGIYEGDMFFEERKNMSFHYFIINYISFFFNYFS